MDLLTVLMLCLSFVGAMAFRLLCGELQDWMPTVTRRIVDRAVARLPKEERERYREEWYAHLDECPGKLGKLYHAVGCLRASHAPRFTNQAKNTSLSEPTIYMIPGNHDQVNGMEPSGAPYLSLDQLFEKFVSEIEPSDGTEAIKNRMRKFVHADIPFDDPNWDEFVAAVKSCSAAVRAAGWKPQSP
jgi:hypothetical protein